MNRVNVVVSKSIEEIVVSIRALNKKGRYLDAFVLAEENWGPIDSWQGLEKQILAIRLYSNLGGERKSDALLLRLWRQNRLHPELNYRMLFYKINRLGPILAKEFLETNENAIAKDKSLIPEILAFKSIIQRSFKNYSDTERLLDEAENLSDQDNWIASLKIQLLVELNDLKLAEKQAISLLKKNVGAYNLKVLSNIIIKDRGSKFAIEQYHHYINQIQTVDCWLDLARLYANLHDWENCETAVSQFLSKRIFEDKLDNRIVRTLQGQIAAYKGDTDTAIAMLSTLNVNYWNIVCENLKTNGSKVDKKILEVPFLRQEHMTCAPTTLAALSKFWGVDVTSKEIADEICFDGTPDTKERQWLKDNGFYFKEFELDSQLAYQLIDNNIPFALVTTAGLSSHLQAVIGHNRQHGTLYLMDPSEPVMQEILCAEMIESEAFNGARCIAFVPTDKKDLLEQFHFPYSNLFEIYNQFSLAKEQNDFQSAQKASNQLEALEPSHRLTLLLQRSLAIWNNDNDRLLKINGELLKRYENETILLSSKFYCLRDLGKREKGLNEARDYLSEHADLDLLCSLFFEVYDLQEYNELTVSWLKKLKVQGCYSAYAHWSIANYYWSKQKHDEANEYYRYAYCLNQTDSQYIESYFKASRHLNKQQQTIDFLIERYNKYQQSSAIPAISVFRAYELLDQEHIGFDYLFSALKQHSSDIELLLFLANKLTSYGLFEKLEEIRPLLQNRLDPVDYLEIVAIRDEKLGDVHDALDFYKRMFDKSPFVSKYAQGYFRILLKIGDTNTLNSVLETLYKENQNNSVIHEYVSDWHQDPKFQHTVLTHFVKIRPDYGVARRQLIDLKLQLGLLDESVQLAQNTCSKINGEMINHSYLAKCFLKVGKFKEARKEARYVLSVAIDNDLAFSILLQASRTNKEKVESLRFVLQEIEQQVVFGDAIWNFWFDAKAILETHELEKFVDHCLTVHGDLWFSYCVSSLFYKQTGDIEKAKKLLLEGSVKFPLLARIYFDLGKLYEVQGDFENTIINYQKALRINPGWSEVAKELSTVYEKQNDVTSASEVICKTLKHNSHDGILYGYLADLLIKNEDDAAALNALEKAVQLETDYRWAWNSLVNVCNRLNKQEHPLEFANTLARNAPFKASVWRDLAYLTNNHESKLALFDRSISCDKYFVPTYKDKVQYYNGLGDYQAAFEVLSSTPWNDELPIELGVVKAELYTDVGQIKNAKETLKSILFNVHGYSYIWKSLFNLFDKEMDVDDFVHCCHKSVEQNRHDPEILCYAGEMLERVESQIDETANYLLRAYQLAPNDQYIVLTYVDNLMKCSKFEEALSVLTEFEQFNQDSYSNTRKIKVMCRLNNSKEAFQIFQQMLLNNEENYWCLNESFTHLSNDYTFEQLELLFDKPKLSKKQAFFIASKRIEKDQSSYAKFLKYIKTIDNEAVWSGSCLALFEYWNEQNIAPRKDVINANYSRILTDKDLVAQLGVGYLNNSDFSNMLNLFRNIQCEEELPAFSLYHFSLALQYSNCWDEATRIIQLGLSKEPDFTIHNIKLWYAYDQVRNGISIDDLDLELIDYHELIESERYVYCTLKVIQELGDEHLDGNQQKLMPYLRKCQQDYQLVSDNYLSQSAKFTLKQYLKSRISCQDFFSKMKMRFWLFNNV